MLLASVPPVGRATAAVLVSLLLTSCGGADRPGITYTAAPGWTEYASDRNIIRLRKAGSEAIIDLGFQPLGPENENAWLKDFARYYQQFAPVSAPAVVTEEADATVGGVAGKRISFEGKRPDTGVPTAGVHYLLDGGTKAYDLIYLGAGPDIEATRAEAMALIESVRFGT